MKMKRIGENSIEYEKVNKGKLQKNEKWLIRKDKKEKFTIQ